MALHTEQEKQFSLEEILIAVLRSELQMCELDPVIAAQITVENIPALYRLSKMHDLAHILASALDKLGMIGEDAISAKLQKQAMIAIYRCENFKHAFPQICEALEADRVDYIPLKGSIIRPYYPRESMRTSSDIDIFVRYEDIERACAAVSERIGYQKSGESFEEISYMSPGGVHLEFHFYDQKDHSDDTAFLEHAWENTVQTSQNRYDLTPAYFLFYHIAHMAKHFNHGGCGIRPFMDLWIMEHKMGIDRHCADALLQQYGFLPFAAGCFELTDAWFGGGSHSDLTVKMADYLMHAGVYGSMENQTAVVQAKTGSRYHNLWKQVFLSRKQLSFTYPILNKYPILYPVCTVRRAFRVLKKRGSSGTLNRMRRTVDVSDARKNHVTDLLRELGFS